MSDVDAPRVQFVAKHQSSVEDHGYLDRAASLEDAQAGEHIGRLRA